MSKWDKTPVRPRTVVIEEYYMEIANGDIYRYWRFESHSNWHTVKTAYKTLPYTLFNETVDPKELEKE